MNAIIIKVNDKVIGVSKITDITTKRFLELEREVVKNWQDKDQSILYITNKLQRLEFYCEELEAKINYLGKQIAIDRGEIDADSEEEYVITIEKIKDEEPQEESEEHE